MRRQTCMHLIAMHILSLDVLMGLVTLGIATKTSMPKRRFAR